MLVWFGVVLFGLAGVALCCFVWFCLIGCLVGRSISCVRVFVCLVGGLVGRFRPVCLSVFAPRCPVLFSCYFVCPCVGVCCVGLVCFVSCGPPLCCLCVVLVRCVVAFVLFSWFGLVWFGLLRLVGPVWFGVARSGLLCFVWCGVFVCVCVFVCARACVFGLFRFVVLGPGRPRVVRSVCLFVWLCVWLVGWLFGRSAGWLVCLFGLLYGLVWFGLVLFVLPGWLCV